MKQKQYKHYIIYRIVNNINGKIYIGKHKCNNLDDNYFGSGKLLRYAINKYGIENFTFHLEIDLKSQEEMDLLEQLVVNSEFLKRLDVYNISRGGKNPCMYGKDNPFYGKTHTKEFIEYIRKKLKNKKLSDETKKKISEGLKKHFELHPEYKNICAQSTFGKKKYINIETGKSKMFKVGEKIPDNYIKPIKPEPTYISKEQRQKNIEKIKQRCKNSKWYNNGKYEKFCIIGTQPTGYILGRLPTINVGRKHSKETLEKLSNSHKGLVPSNKGKIFITNGINNRYISKTDIIPHGWWKGLTTRKNKK